jgi:dolichol-phosphate mannosyltransferase
MENTPATKSARSALIPRREQPSSISVVIPCYNEEEVLPELRRRVSSVFSELGIPYEIILIDDGSKDGTWSVMASIAEEDPRFKVIKLSRNRGHQIALTCGLDQARGQVILIMDADLQDPPELVHEMLKRWHEGYDVAYGKRSQRHGEPRLKIFFAFFFYRAFKSITGFELPSDTGDFRLMDRRALNALQSMRERHRFIRGMVSWIGFNQTPVFYDRPPRYAGVTKYPFKKSLFLAVDAITSFSYAPLRIASYLGSAISAFSFVYIFVVIVLKFLDINFPGYTSIMASVLLLGGMQLLVLGLIGEYVGRIFEQGQMRPLYFIDNVIGEPLEPPRPPGS